MPYLSSAIPFTKDPIIKDIRYTAYQNLIFSQHDTDLPHFLQMGQATCSKPTYSYKGSCHNRHVSGIFQYTLSGRGMLEYEGRRYMQEPGMAFLVEANTDYHYYLPRGWEPWEVLFFVFTGADFQRNFHIAIERLGPVVTLPRDHAVIRTCYTLLAELAVRSFVDAEDAVPFTMRMAMELRRLATAPLGISAPIARACQYATVYLTTDIGVPELAAAAGLFRAHFSRLFRRQTGMTPLQYLSALRLQQAQSLLRWTSMSIETISLQCGFADANYFYTVYRKSFGITPSAYRRNELPTRDPLRSLIDFRTATIALSER